MLVIPLQAAPVQNVMTVVAQQNCQIYLYQNYRGMFFDLNVNGEDVVNGIICENQNELVPIHYTGFEGNFVFLDTQGSSDPVYTGLNSRYFLVYITAEENEVVGFA